MRPVQFPAMNTIIGREIPANSTNGIILTRWRATWRERLSILWHGTIWLAVIGDRLPPVLVSGDQEFEMENAPWGTHIGGD